MFKPLAPATILVTVLIILGSGFFFYRSWEGNYKQSLNQPASSLDKTINQEAYYSTSEPTSEVLSWLRNGKYSYRPEANSLQIDTIQLINGKMVVPNPGGLSEHYEYDKYFLVDINGDGIHEILVALWHSLGVNRIEPIIFLLANEDRQLKQVAYKDLPDRTEVISISSANQIITLNARVVGESKFDPLIPKIIKYKLDNKHLIEIN